MGLCSRGRFEGHGADWAFIEDLTVSTLDVGLKSCNISEDHTTVDTAIGRTINVNNKQTKMNSKVDSTNTKNKLAGKCLFALKFDVPVANSSGVVQAVFSYVGLKVDRSTTRSTFRADVR